MHAFSVAVFLMGVSAVMAVPTNEAMPQTVGDVAATIVASPHVDAAVEGFLANSGNEDPMDSNEVDAWDGENDDGENGDGENGDGENGDDWDGDDDGEDDGEWDEDNDEMDDSHDDDDGMMDDFGNKWTEENASEVSESNGKDGEEDMPSNASYEMSYDAEAGQSEADHSVDVNDDGEADEKHGEDDAMPAAANTTATPAEAKPASEKMSCTINAEGYSPKEMTVKPGSEISFKVDGEGEYSVKQTSGPNSCEAMAGGFSSKAMLKGDDWSYTVPQNATGKMYMYSGPADKCDTKMLATITVGDNLVADTKANTPAANPSGTTSGLSSGAGSTAPALGSVAAAAVIAARTLF